MVFIVLAESCLLYILDDLDLYDSDERAAAAAAAAAVAAGRIVLTSVVLFVLVSESSRIQGHSYIDPKQYGFFYKDTRKKESQNTETAILCLQVIHVACLLLLLLYS